jgi:hypothetical protein
VDYVPEIARPPLAAFFLGAIGKPKKDKSATDRGKEGSCVRKRGWMNIKNSKDRGAWAELCFAARAMEEALRPARPTGEPSGYDFLVHHKSTRIFRVQVKSTIYKMGRCYHCTIRTRNHVYKKGSFDFVAGYVIPEDVWYILPEKLIRGMSTVGLYPAMPGAKYDAYKEAWHLLRGESPGKVKSIQACAEESALSPRFSVLDRPAWVAPFVFAARFVRWRFIASHPHAT